MFATSAAAAPGDLDVSFGSGGRVTTVLPGVHFADHAVQPDGGIVVVGTATSDTVVARYRADGTLDPDFGTAGMVTLPNLLARSVASHLGGIVLAGEPTSPARAFFVARLLADGTFDPDFGTAGLVVESSMLSLGGPPDPSVCGEGGVMIADDGDIVVGLALQLAGSGMGAVRYDATGTSDPSFVGDDRIVLSTSSLRFGVGLVSVGGNCTDVALDGAGGIVFSGWKSVMVTPMTFGEIAVGARLRADTGAVDTGFGGDGAVEMGEIPMGGPFHYAGEAVAGDGIGRLLLSVDGNTSGLFRFLADGTALDPSFSSAPSMTALHVDAAGRIVGLRAGVRRLLGDGSPDPDFGTGGSASVSFPSWPATSLDTLSEDPDGNIVVGGRLRATSNADDGFALARLRANPTPAGPRAGKVLALSTSSVPNARKLSLTSVDPDLGIGDGADSGHDPRLAGATLRVRSDAGAPFDGTYDMPAAGWSAIVKRGEVVGWQYRGEAGPIQRVTLLEGKKLKITARGADLAHDLSADPDPVVVTFSLGDYASCLVFGGEARFRPGRSYKAKEAPAPATCP